MFFTTAGTVFQIGGDRQDWTARPVTAGDFSGETWVPVSGISSLGRIGGEWTGSEFTLPEPLAPDAPLMTTFEKVVRPTPTMQIIAGIIGNDPGQLAMLAAEASIAPYAFRMMLADGAARRFVALVTAADHIFDEANAVLCWAFSLRLQSDVLRS